MLIAQLLILLRLEKVLRVVGQDLVLRRVDLDGDGNLSLVDDLRAASQEAGRPAHALGIVDLLRRAVLHRREILPKLHSLPILAPEVLKAEGHAALLLSLFQGRAPAAGDELPFAVLQHIGVDADGFRRSIQHHVEEVLVRVRPQELGHGLLLLVQLRGLNVHNRSRPGGAPRQQDQQNQKRKYFLHRMFPPRNSALPSLRPGFPPDSQSERKFFLPTFSYKKK